MSATASFFSFSLGGLQRMCACDGVGVVQGDGGGLARLIWIEEECVIAGAVEEGAAPNIALFSEEWQISLLESLSLLSPASPRLDG